MFGLEYIGIATLFVKSVILLMIGFQTYRLLDEFLEAVTKEQLLSQTIAVFVALVTIFFVREMFLILLVVIVVFLYLFGWVGKILGLLRAA